MSEAETLQEESAAILAKRKFQVLFFPERRGPRHLGVEDCEEGLGIGVAERRELLDVAEDTLVELAQSQAGVDLDGGAEVVAGQAAHRDLIQAFAEFGHAR